MDRLPTEIIFEIIANFSNDEPHDCSCKCSYLAPLAALSQTSRRLYHIATPLIYRHDVQNANRAVLWSAFHGCMGTLQWSKACGADCTQSGSLASVPGLSVDACGTPLQVAAYRGHLEAASLLLEYGVNIDAVGFSICDCQHGDFPYFPSPPWTSLHTALCRGHVQMVELLLRNGANHVMSRDHASHISDTEFVRNGVVVTRASRGVHVLDSIAKERGKYLGLFKLLLELSDGDLEARQKLKLDVYETETVTPLHRAAAVTDSKDDLEFISLLLSNGARLYPSHECSGNASNQLPFDRAIIGWVEDAKTSRFLSPGKSRSGDSYTKLLAFLDHFQHRHPEHLPTLMGRVLELWLSRGSPSLDSAWSLLYHTFKLYGVSIHSPALVRTWVLRSLRQPRIEQAGDMSVAEVMAFLPKLGFPTSLLHPLDELLVEAARNGLEAETRWLIKHGGDINALCPRQGSAPLHMAVKSGDEAFVELLLAQGADIHLPNQRGHTAVQIALQFRRNKIVELLRLKGGEVDVHQTADSSNSTSHQTLVVARIAEMSQRVF